MSTSKRFSLRQKYTRIAEDGIVETNRYSAKTSKRPPIEASSVRYKHVDVELGEYDPDKLTSYTPYQIKIVQRKNLVTEKGFSNPNYQRCQSCDHARNDVIPDFIRSVSEDPSLYLLGEDRDYLVLDKRLLSRRKQRLITYVRKQCLWRRFSTAGLRRRSVKWRKSFRKVFRRDCLTSNRIKFVKLEDEKNFTVPLKKERSPMLRTRTISFNKTFDHYKCSSNNSNSKKAKDVWVVKIREVKVKNSARQWKHKDKGMKIKANDRSSKWTSNVT